jgi:hypothetical protein
MVEQKPQFRAGIAIAVMPVEGIPPISFVEQRTASAVRIGLERTAVGSLFRFGHLEMRRIVDTGVVEALCGKPDRGTVQVDEAPLLEFPAGYCDPPRPVARKLVKAAQRKQHVLKRVERELLRNGALIHLGLAPPRVMLRQQPVTLRLTAWAGRGKGLATRENQQRAGVGGREFYGMTDVFDVEARLASLEIAQIPGAVGVRITMKVPDRMPGTNDEMFEWDGCIISWERGSTKLEAQISS